jgi:GNAT superfamily N-acetyltransferase
LPDVVIRELELRDAPGCDAVIASLPDFFGLASGIEACARAVRSERGIVAVDPSAADRVLGFATWKHHRPHSAEITWAGVDREHRNQRLGRTIVGEVERCARASGATWLTVMTLSPNDSEPESYAPTRHFWHTVGFTELCDLDVWDEDLAVLMAKVLG